MFRAVILLHSLADGSSHHDLLLESLEAAGADARNLAAFRMSGRADGLGKGARAEAERLPDHRAVYLDYEGEVPGGRGRVERVASGALEWIANEPELVEVDVRWAGGSRAQRLRIESLDTAKGRWIVRSA